MTPNFFAPFFLYKWSCFVSFIELSEKHKHYLPSICINHFSFYNVGSSQFTGSISENYFVNEYPIYSRNSIKVKC